jgi:hypothetical protein
MISIINEKVKDISENNNGYVFNKNDPKFEYFLNNQTNNNLERFKNLAQSVKSIYKKNSEINKCFANNSKLLDKKLLVANMLNKSNSNSKIIKNENFNINNNFEKSLNDYSKNLILLSPIKKNINLDKVNLSFLNNKNYDNYELTSCRVKK